MKTDYEIELVKSNGIKRFKCKSDQGNFGYLVYFKFLQKSGIRPWATGQKADIWIHWVMGACPCLKNIAKTISLQHFITKIKNLFSKWSSVKRPNWLRVDWASQGLNSVTRRKSHNVYKSCPKMISLENERFWHLYKICLGMKEIWAN